MSLHFEGSHTPPLQHAISLHLVGSHVAPLAQVAALQAVPHWPWHISVLAPFLTFLFVSCPLALTLTNRTITAARNRTLPNLINKFFIPFGFGLTDAKI
jgi:hypothetical protein